MSRIFSGSIVLKHLVLNCLRRVHASRQSSLLWIVEIHACALYDCGRCHDCSVKEFLNYLGTFIEVLAGTHPKKKKAPCYANTFTSLTGLDRWVELIKT